MHNKLKWMNQKGEDNMSQERSYRSAIAVLIFAFFMWGFLTALNDILVPHLKAIFNLDYAKAMLVQFCFFITYGLMSIPMAKLISKIGYKAGVVLGFVIAGLGCLLFLPAAAMKIYGAFLFGLFILASGIVLLQVAANPYVTLLGRPETASRRLTLAQAFNSLGTTLAPWFGAVLILSVAVKSTAELNSMSVAQLQAYDQTLAYAIQKPYLILAIVMLIIGLLIAFIPLPKMLHHERQNITISQLQSTRERSSIWKYKHFLLGCVAIFVYVGAEVAIGSFLVSYLMQPNIANYTAEHAADYVAVYWGGALIGRFIGSYLLGKINPPKILTVHAVLAIVLVLTTIFSQGTLAMWSILAVGLFNSVMFPTIFSLAIRGLGKHTPSGSGMLCVAIVGGAFIPLLQGLLADRIGIQMAFIIPVICYLFILYYGIKGYDKSFGLVDVKA
ncbi:MAG: glucose/galactose transporter [Gammaproteobacteria bacterium]|jgi:FHS family L-fucose permease-like MFS transporter|nr:glucose/galactose transporter [Gammaproteobacteria bacterium]